MMKKCQIDLIDFHTHILPGADHGSASIDVSLSQLDLASKSGVSRIFATSHFYPHLHTVSAYIEKRNRAYNSLISSCELPVKIKLGAEVLLCDNLHKLDSISELCIHGTNCLLLELPFKEFTSSMVHAVKRLVNMGYEVILAHADRYPKDNIERLIDFGAEIQLNADSLAGIFKKKHLYSWIDRGLVVGIGSDIHGSDPRAYKNFVTAKNKIGEKLFDIARESDKIWDKALSF